MSSPSPRVVLGVAGGIAAYKAVEVLRRLTESGHSVTVVPTASALSFVGAATWAALSGQPVSTEVWDHAEQVPHVALGRAAHLVLVVPATADLLSRAATGRCDDLLTATLLTATCPQVYAPAMHTEMWRHPAVVANVSELRSRGAVVLEPASGRLTGADAGPGRLPDPEDIVGNALAVLGRGAPPRDLTGRQVLVTAGGTREPLDPVRYLTNRSSGRQGYALARAAALRGAEVTLISTAALPDPAAVRMVRVETAAELLTAVRAASRDADAVVMAAAVADYRPAARSEHKIKKAPGDAGLALELERTEDILAAVSGDRGRPGQVVVGFAAETEHVLAHGTAKLASKGCDLLVVNRVGDGIGFEVEHNAAVILSHDAEPHEIATTTKDLLAHEVWDLVVRRLA